MEKKIGYWGVVKRTRKYDKKATDYVIGVIAKIAAKEHRRLFGYSPVKMVDEDLGFLVYHYHGSGLNMLDSVIVNELAKPSSPKKLSSSKLNDPQKQSLKLLGQDREPIDDSFFDCSDDIPF